MDALIPNRKSLVSLLRAPAHLLSPASHLSARVHLGLLEVRHLVLEVSHPEAEVLDQSSKSSQLHQLVIFWPGLVPPPSYSEPATPSSGLSMSWLLVAWSLGWALTLKARLIKGNSRAWRGTTCFKYILPELRYLSFLTSVYGTLCNFKHQYLHMVITCNFLVEIVAFESA